MRLFLAILMLCMLASVGGCSTRGADDEGRVILSYTRWGTPSEMESTKELVQQFMDEHPDILVRVDVVGWEQYWQKMATAVATDTAQDVWLMDPGYVEQYAGAGHLLDLMPFLNADATFKLDDYFSYPFDDFCFRRTETGRVAANGEKDTELTHALFGEPGASCFAFTRDYNCALLYFNRDHFDTIGLAYPNENWTWDDLAAAAMKLTIDKDGDGFIDQWGFFGLAYNHLASANGGRMMDVPSRRSTYRSKEVLDAIRFCRDLVYKYKVAPEPDMQVEGAAFTNGKASMTISGVWNIRAFSRSKSLWDVTAIPVDRPGRKRVNMVEGVAHCIYSKTKHPKEAWKLVKFFSSEKSQRELAKSGTSVPVLKSAAFSKDFLAPFHRPSPEGRKVIFRCLTDRPRIPKFTRGYLTYTEYARDMIRGVWMGIRTPEEACKMIDAFTDKVLAEQYHLDDTPASPGERTDVENTP